MKKILFTIIGALIISSFSSFNTLGAQTKTQTLWDRANGLYASGEFSNAIDYYNQIEQKGVASSELYYNMGNTYYRLNQVGKSILYYEKALKADPSNSDAKANLAIANLLTVDKIDQVPEFIVVTWLREFRNILSSEGWARLALIFLGAGLACLLLFKFASSLFRRKLSFVMACVLGFFSIISFGFGTVLALKARSSDEAITISAFGNVKSAPNATGNSIFVLHEGTKVAILEEVSGWSRIEIKDGRQGWILSSDIATI